MLSGNQYVYKKNYFPDFSCTHQRMCVYERYAPGFFNLADQSYNLDLIPFTNKSKASKYIHLLQSCPVPGKCVSGCPLSICAFLALQGFKLTLEVKKLAPTPYVLKSKG